MESAPQGPIYRLRHALFRTDPLPRARICPRPITPGASMSPTPTVPLCLVAAAIFLVTNHVSAAPDAADAAMAPIRPDGIRANMSFLADDALEGRGTATRGYEIAAKFMATRFEAMG